MGVEPRVPLMPSCSLKLLEQSSGKVPGEHSRKKTLGEGMIERHGPCRSACVAAHQFPEVPRFARVIPAVAKSKVCPFHCTVKELKTLVVLSKTKEPVGVGPEPVTTAKFSVPLVKVSA